MRTYSFLIFTFLLFVFSSCSNRPSANGIPSRTAMSSLNVVCIITQDSLHKYPELKDSIEFALQAPVRVLPQPEPRFDLIPFSYRDIANEPLRRALKYYVVLADYSDKESDITKMIRNDIGAEKINEQLSKKPIIMFVGKDKWAQKQTVIYVVGENAEALKENLRSLEPRITKIISEKEWPRIEASTYVIGRATLLEKLVQENYNFFIKIPKQYQRATADSSFTWYRRETEKVSMSLIFSSIPYDDKSQLTYEGLKAIQNEMGQYVTTTLPNTRMVINDVDLPMYVTPVNINGFQGLEARGIWEIENDFMGGSFISYLLINPLEPNKLIFMQGFMYAPNVEKRNYMQQLEYILKTIDSNPIEQKRR